MNTKHGKTAKVMALYVLEEADTHVYTPHILIMNGYKIALIPWLWRGMFGWMGFSLDINVRRKRREISYINLRFFGWKRCRIFSTSNIKMNWQLRGMSVGGFGVLEFCLCPTEFRLAQNRRQIFDMN